jgi:hypothetical protein
VAQLKRNSMAKNAKQQAAIAISMKKAGKKPLTKKQDGGFDRPIGMYNKDGVTTIVMMGGRPSGTKDDYKSKKEIRKEKINEVKGKIKYVASNIKNKITGQRSLKTITSPMFKKGGATNTKKK